MFGNNDHLFGEGLVALFSSLINIYKTWVVQWSTPKHQPKHKLDKWFNLDRFVLFCTYVRMYGRTPSPEIMNHFSSLCFGLCLGVDQYKNTGGNVLWTGGCYFHTWFINLEKLPHFYLLNTGCTCVNLFWWLCWCRSVCPNKYISDLLAHYALAN